jgi:hypothetical protein
MKNAKILDAFKVNLVTSFKLFGVALDNLLTFTRHCSNFKKETQLYTKAFFNYKKASARHREAFKTEYVS